MKFHPFIAMPVTALVVIAASHPVVAAPDAVKTVRSATSVLQEFTDNARIPKQILRNSQGIAIIPKVVQAGFFFGGQRGQGVMLVRRSDGSWSHPAVITVTGGSVGLQFGAKSSDVILVFRDAASIRKVYDSDFRIGGNVTATAGPEQAEAVKPTDTTGRIYSYTRSEGLFAGVALSGIKLAYDDEKTADLYGQKQITARQVFTSRDLKPPAVVSDLKQTLRRGASGN